MRPVDLILKKRNGGELCTAEIRSLVSGYIAGSVTDYQMAAFAMAVFFRGMTREETAGLTLAMAESGQMLNLSRAVGRP
ncbi:MAG: pyrimidine-nucleoside phosphorylase, partial [Bacillota bacterium]